MFYPKHELMLFQARIDIELRSRLTSFRIRAWKGFEIWWSLVSRSILL